MKTFQRNTSRQERISIGDLRGADRTTVPLASPRQVSLATAKRDFKAIDESIVSEPPISKVVTVADVMPSPVGVQ